MRRYFGFAVLTGGIFLATFLAGFGCSKKNRNSPVVAEIGGEKISVEEITEPLARQRWLFASAAEELAAKQRLLDSIVETKLLLQEAYREKLDQDSLIRAFEELERPLFLIDLLYFQEVRDKVRLSKKEVLRFYQLFKTDRCFKQILTSQKRAADSLLSLTQKGASFDSLARHYSRDPISSPKGGDIGCYGWSRRLPDEVLIKTAEMKRGEYAGPFKIKEGWVILQCYEHRPAELPDMKVFEPELRNLVEAYRVGIRSAEFVAEVRRNLDFRIIDSAARFVNVKQRELSKIVTPGQPDRFSIYIRTEELTPAQRSMPLLTYKGGDVTVGQYLEILQGSMPMSRLTLDTTEITKAMLFQLVFRDAMVRTALAKGLDKDPMFLKMVKGAVDGQIARLAKGRIVSKVRVDSSQVRAYYRAHSEEFVQPAAYHLYEINRPTSEELLIVKRQAKNKSHFTSFATQMTNRISLRPKGGDMDWVEQHQFPELFSAAAKMGPGEIAGPIRLADGSFSLIYLEAKRPAQKLAFDQVKEELLQRLWVKAEDSVFAAWMEEQRKKVKMTVYPEVLERTIDRTYYAKLKEWREKLKGEIG